MAINWSNNLRNGSTKPWTDPITIGCTVLLLAIVWSHPHGISCEGVQGQGPQVCEEHLKDEEGFFAWAELYLEGKYALPVSDAGGVYISTSVTNPNPLAENYDLSATMV